MLTNSAPVSKKSRIHSKDEFELCYLRHKYVEKCKYVPTEAEIEEYMYIARKIISVNYYTYMPLFRSIPLDQTDLHNIARVHIVSFIGLFSMEHNAESKEAFQKAFVEHKMSLPDDKDHRQKNHATFTLFFRQRMQDLVRICRQKSRNIRGKVLEEYCCYSGLNQPPTNPNLLFKEADALGFKRIDSSVFKSIRKKADVEFDATLFEYEGIWYVALVTDHSVLSFEEVLGAGIDPRDNLCHQRPDEIYDEIEFQGFSAQFANCSSYHKIKTLRDFVAKNQNKKYYTKEVKTAKSMLRKLGV